MIVARRSPLNTCTYLLSMIFFFRECYSGNSTLLTLLSLSSRLLQSSASTTIHHMCVWGGGGINGCWGQKRGFMCFRIPTAWHITRIAKAVCPYASAFMERVSVGGHLEKLLSKPKWRNLLSARGCFVSRRHRQQCKLCNQQCAPHTQNYVRVERGIIILLRVQWIKSQLGDPWPFVKEYTCTRGKNYVTGEVSPGFYMDIGVPLWHGHIENSWHPPGAHHCHLILGKTRKMLSSTLCFWKIDATMPWRVHS